MKKLRAMLAFLIRIRNLEASERNKCIRLCKNKIHLNGKDALRKVNGQMMDLENNCRLLFIPYKELLKICKKRHTTQWENG